MWNTKKPRRKPEVMIHFSLPPHLVSSGGGTKLLPACSPGNCQWEADTPCGTVSLSLVALRKRRGRKIDAECGNEYPFM